MELSAEERHLLHEGYRTGKRHAFRKRCHVVLLKAEGRSSKDIGRIVEMHEVSVNNWLNRYETEGLAGLFTKEGRGREVGGAQSTVQRRARGDTEEGAGGRDDGGRDKR